MKVWPGAGTLAVQWRYWTTDGYRAGLRADGRWRVERDGTMVVDNCTCADAAHAIAMDRGARRRAFDRTCRRLLAGRLPYRWASGPWAETASD